MAGLIQSPDHHIYPGRVFGKLYPKFSKKMLHFEDYATPSLPLPPARVDWTRGFHINWSMFLNDSLGCCVEAAKGHAIQTLTMDNGRLITVPDSAILSNYEATGNYIPGDQSTDNGEVEVDSLTAWQRSSVGGYKLSAFAGMRINQIEHVQQAIYLMGGVFAGFQVPQSAMDQNAAGLPWDIVKHDGGIVGGHAVWVPMYDTRLNLMTCITWAGRQLITWAFWQKYFDEAYVLKSPDWISSRGSAPSGFLSSQWDADVNALAARH